MTRDPKTAELNAWLWLFCGLLSLPGPIGLALEASQTVGSLAYGDVAHATALAVRVALTGLGVAAALALVRRHKVGLTLARATLATSVAFALTRAATPFVPSSFAPSDEWIRFGAVALHAAGWWTYLATSGRVRRVYGIK